MMCPVKQLRVRIDELLQSSRWADAHLCLGDLWRQEPKAATAGFISSCYERLRPHLSLTECRIGFLRSMTIEPLIPILTSAALVAGIDPILHASEFNAYAQEILDPDSKLYSFDPLLVFLAIQTRDLLPEV